MDRRDVLQAAALLLLAALLWAPGARADEAPPDPTASIPSALEELRSPAAREREAAVRRLIDLLPGSRGPVLAALPKAPPEVQVHLVEILVADASKPAIRALLEAMNAGDSRLAMWIRTRLARSERATRKVLEAWAEDPSLEQDASGGISERTRALEALLRRAEAERIFISRKSKTGSTGSYRGQYDLLRPYREEALDVCVGLVTDTAIREPGVVRIGNFEFLRPPPVHVDMDELKSMAAHAFSELARPTDLAHLHEMHRHLDELKERLDRYFPGSNEFRVKLDEYADLLVALYLVKPERYRNLMELFLQQISYGGMWRRALIDGSTFRPLILLRIGRYEEAVREFEGLQLMSVSKAGTHYNLACAYAQWAEHTEEPRARARRLRDALRHLEIAVENQWSDIGWMEEDLDLAPIRDTPKFKELVRRVRRQLALPEDD
jgi:hypothetical protein